jgi:hypothetical protein
VDVGASASVAAALMSKAHWGEIIAAFLAIVRNKPAAEGSHALQARDFLASGATNDEAAVGAAIMMPLVERAEPP